MACVLCQFWGKKYSFKLISVKSVSDLEKNYKKTYGELNWKVYCSDYSKKIEGSGGGRFLNIRIEGKSMNVKV